MNSLRIYKVKLGRDEPGQIEFYVEHFDAKSVEDVTRSFVRPEFLKHVSVEEDEGL